LGLFFRTADNHHGEKVGLSIRIHVGPCDGLKRARKGSVRKFASGAGGHQKPFFVGRFCVFG
jgi:hypothetical protein